MNPPSAQFQALKLLLMREFGSFAVFADVSFFFMPDILAQNESRLEPPSGCGGFKFIPCFLAEALPLAFKPPFGFFPSDLCQAGVLAMITAPEWVLVLYQEPEQQVLHQVLELEAAQPAQPLEQVLQQVFERFQPYQPIPAT
jgi:hypothetical protein